MGERSEKMIQGILDSYREHEMTVRIDEENIICAKFCSLDILTRTE